MPRLKLRTFLFLSLLLGAIVLPMGYKYFKARREAEVERLTKELEKRYAKQPHIIYFSSFFSAQQGPTSILAEWQKWEKIVIPLENRLEELTGSKPIRPPLQQIDQF